MKAKPTLIIVIAIALVLSSIYFLFTKKPTNSIKSSPSQNVVENNNQILEANMPSKTEKAPSVFPTGLPMEKNAEVIVSFNTINPATKENIYSKSFVTSQSREENIKLYTDYLTAQKWTITKTENEKDFQGMFATKGKTKISIFFVNRVEEKRNAISIVFTYPTPVK